MSQYRAGTVSVTSGSNAVVGSGTQWTRFVTSGSVFTVVGSNVPYVVGSVIDDTHLSLSSNYVGTTAAGESYTIGTSFTPNLGLPYVEQGDVETATILKRAMLLIDQVVPLPNVTINATSATSLAPGNGSQSFVTQPGKQFAYPQFLVIASAANAANYMAGQVTSYDAVTGALVVDVTTFGGSGAHSDWNISLSGISGRGINWTGAWNAATSYALADGVSENGSAYLCIAPHTNQMPPNAVYWSVLDLGIFYRGAWATATPYNINDIVKDSSSTQNVYVCVANHTSGVLATDVGAGKWDLLVDAASAAASAATATSEAVSAAGSASAAAASATAASGSETSASSSAAAAAGSAASASAAWTAAIASTPDLNPVIRMNPSTVTSNLTIPSGYNAYSAGPLEIADGVTVTLNDNSTWSIL